MTNITFFHMKIIVFTVVKNGNIIHRHVFVMKSDHICIENVGVFYFLESNLSTRINVITLFSMFLSVLK